MIVVIKHYGKRVCFINDLVEKSCEKEKLTDFLLFRED